MPRQRSRRDGMDDVRLMSLPEVPEAGSIPDALAQIGSVLKS